jgi:hypothetical protein
VVAIEESEKANPGSAQLVQTIVHFEISESGLVGKFDRTLQQEQGSGETGAIIAGYVEFATWPAPMSEVQ